MADASLPIAVTRLPSFVPGMRIGLFGGSFDPPHAGHLMVSLVARRALRLDQVWWLVSPQNPLKKNAPSEDLVRRVEAARAFITCPFVKVTGIEAALGTTYTADTLSRLLPMLTGIRPVWMMGADSLASFHRWGHWESIAATLPIAVFNRPGATLAALASPAARTLSAFRIPEWQAPSLPALDAPAWVFLSKPHIPLSSTALRGLRAKSPKPS